MIDEARWRRIMGHWATGVSVVTSLGLAGPRGATATALTSLSLDPLLLLVCFSHASNTLRAVRESGRLGVNILSADQEQVAHRFAVKQPADDKFADIAYTVVCETPVIDGTLAWAVCDVHEELRGGDHAIVIAAPLEGDVADGFEPLLHYGSAYRRLEPI